MITRSVKVSLALVLVAGLAVVLLFVRMYRSNVTALEGFITAYDRFDGAMPSAAGPVGPEELGPAEGALTELRARAAMRLSSLIRNDRELMVQAREISDLAKREFESKAGGSAEDPIALREKREAAFASFLALGSVKSRDSQIEGGDREEP